MYTIANAAPVALASLGEGQCWATARVQCRQPEQRRLKLKHARQLLICHGSYRPTINGRVPTDHINYTRWVEIASGKGCAQMALITPRDSVHDFKVYSCVAIVAALAEEMSVYAICLICDTYLW